MITSKGLQGAALWVGLWVTNELCSSLHSRPLAQTPQYLPSYSTTELSGHRFVTASRWSWQHRPSTLRQRQTTTMEMVNNGSLVDWKLRLYNTGTPGRSLSWKMKLLYEA